MRGRLAIACFAVAVLAVGLAAVLLIPDSPDGETPSDLTVDEVYRRASETLHDSGKVYRALIETEGESFASYSARTQMWVDPSRQVAREESTFEFNLPSGPRQPIRYAAIHASEASYRVEDGKSSAVRARTCYGADLATSVAVGCPGFTEESTTTVANGSHRGRKALVLVKEGTSRGSDETFVFTERLYVDPKTYLPVALESEGTLNDQTAAYTRRSYKTEWLARESLPPNFFDAAAIGYVAPDPEAGIRDARDLQVYWLGRDFSAPGVEQLVLKSSFAAPGRGAPYRYSLTYVRASHPFEPPVLDLQIFFRDMWDSVKVIGPFTDQAVLLGETVVFFSEGTVPGSTDRILTPEALEQLKRGLRPYDIGP